MNLFNKNASDQGKTDGMTLAAESRPDHLLLARRLALEIVRRKGTVNADDVGRLLHTRYSIGSLGGAAGSIFSEPHWEFTGQRVTSERESNHGRELKVWKLKYDPAPALAVRPAFCDCLRDKWRDSPDPKRYGWVRTVCQCGRFMGYRPLASDVSVSSAEEVL